MDEISNFRAVKCLLHSRSTHFMIYLFLLSLKLYRTVRYRIYHSVKWNITLHLLRRSQHTSRSLSGGGEGLLFRPLPRDFDPELLHVLSSRSLMGVEGLCTVSNSPVNNMNTVKDSTSFLDQVWVFMINDFNKSYNRKFLMTRKIYNHKYTKFEFSQNFAGHTAFS